MQGKLASLLTVNFKHCQRPISAKCRAATCASAPPADAAHPSGDHAAARTGGLSRRGTLTAVVALATAVAFKPRDAAAAEDAIGAGDAAAASTASGAPQTVYFGNGCFWGRQKDFVDVEKSLGRSPDKVSAIVGYAGGRKTGGYSAADMGTIPGCGRSRVCTDYNVHSCTDDHEDDGLLLLPAGPDGRVCYYYGPGNSVYEKLVRLNRTA
jgi:hypothetical protein